MFSHRDPEAILATFGVPTRNLVIERHRVDLSQPDWLGPGTHCFQPGAEPGSVRRLSGDVHTAVIAVPQIVRVPVQVQGDDIEGFRTLGLHHLGERVKPRQAFPAAGLLVLEVRIRRGNDPC